MKDYFNHFGLLRSYQIDPVLLRKSYYAMSRSIHPDVQESTHSEEEIHTSIAYHNKAYETLRDPLSRLKYLIEIEGKKEDVERPPDPQFLLQMMDFHEEIENAIKSNNENSIHTLLLQLEHFENEKTTQMNPVFALYDTGNREEHTLSNLVSYFVQLKYLHRLRNALLKVEEL